MARLIGITGGIGAGKSALAALLRDFGYPVIDADQIARGVVEEPIVSRQLSELFGSEIFRIDGTMDRAKVRDLVFSDENLRLELEKLTHPPICAHIERALDQLNRISPSAWLFCEAALFAESKNIQNPDMLVLVSCNQERRMQRILETRPIDRSSAERIMALQMSDEEKSKQCDFVIDNSGDRAALAQRTVELLDFLRSHFAASVVSRP